MQSRWSGGGGGGMNLTQRNVIYCFTVNKEKLVKVSKSFNIPEFTTRFEPQHVWHQCLGQTVPYNYDQPSDCAFRRTLLNWLWTLKLRQNIYVHLLPQTVMYQNLGERWKTEGKPEDGILLLRRIVKVELVLFLFHCCNAGVATVLKVTITSMTDSLFGGKIRDQRISQSKDLYKVTSSSWYISGPVLDATKVGDRLEKN